MPLTVIPDANVLVHGRRLADLPWAELARDDVEILIVGPVIRELDGLKNRPGRAGKVARDLSAELRTVLAAPDRTVVLKTSGPRVVQRIWLAREVDAPVREGLRIDHADQSIINLGLARSDDGADVLLLTDDTICGATADEFGLRSMFLPPHWLRPPEPDEQAKEVARLKAENAKLLAAEPRIVLKFRDGRGNAMRRLDAVVTVWPALSTGDLDELMAAVAGACPVATSFERPPARASDALNTLHNRLSRLSSLQSRTVYESATSEEIARYRDVDHPAWLDTVREELERLHVRLAAREVWPTVLLSAANEGSRPADQALLAIVAKGDLRIRSLDDEQDEIDKREEKGGPDPARMPELTSPPVPPRGRERVVDHYDGILGSARHMAEAFRHELPPLARFDPPRPRDADRFYWREGRRGHVGRMELECGSWRHREDAMDFGLRLTGGDRTGALRGAIEARVDGANMSAPVAITLPVSVTMETGSTVDEARALIEAVQRRARSSERR